MWSIQTIETELTEGTHEFIIPRREGEDHALVLVEQLGGEPGELEAEAENIPAKQHSNYQKAKVFMGDFVDGAKDVSLRIHLRATRLIRITVATIRSGAKWIHKKLSCRLCKKLVNLLLTSGLALVGVPYMDTSIVFDDGLLEALRDLLSNPDLGAFKALVEEIDLGIWEAIIKVAASVEFIFEFADKFYEKVCQAIGLCPKAK